MTIWVVIYKCLFYFPVDGNEIIENRLRNIVKRTPNVVREYLNKRHENVERGDGFNIASSVADGVHNALHNVRKTIVNRLVNKPISFEITAQLGNSQYHSKLTHGTINSNYKQQEQADQNYFVLEQQQQHPYQPPNHLVREHSSIHNNNEEIQIQLHDDINGNIDKSLPQFDEQRNAQENTNVVGYLENNFPIILLKENEIRKK